MAENAPGANPGRWREWQRSWDRQQERGIGDREERLGVLTALVGEVGGEQPRVLDLACGCASVTTRLLERLPGARVVALDLDPVLLRIAAGALAGEPRAELVEADLRRSDWAERLPEGNFDAVVTATALHWLSPERLVDVYRSLASLVRPGGVFANSDGIPLGAGGELSRLAGALEAPPLGEGLSWEEWWRAVGEDLELGPLMAERERRFGFGLHPAEFNPEAGWHQEQLLGAGFAQAGIPWRRGNAAVLVAVR